MARIDTSKLTEAEYVATKEKIALQSKEPVKAKQPATGPSIQLVLSAWEGLPENERPEAFKNSLLPRLIDLSNVELNPIIKRVAHVLMVKIGDVTSDINTYKKAVHAEEIKKARNESGQYFAFSAGDTESPVATERYTEWRELYKEDGFTVDRRGRLCQIRETKDGREEKPLANFVARITREVTRDNGHDEDAKIIFEVEGLLPDGRTLFPRFVTASEFPAMNWPLRVWGADALVLPGTATKDALRFIVQSTGRSAQREKVYLHTGWRQIDGKWCYFHAGGAIGGDDIQVDLSDGGQALSRYRLPDGNPGDIAEAARVVINLLDVASRKVTLPLLAMVFLTPLCDLLRRAECEPTFLVWLYGHTGQRKSSLAALFLNFFGHFGRDQLPANFKDSKNMTEKLAFLLKDSLLVVDDYHPTASAKDRIEMNGKAQALLRAYGDRAGRGRMNADTTLKASYVPRGMALVTGEDLPDAGESGAARMLAIEIPQGGVNLEILSECQGMAEHLPSFTRAYLEWLADNWLDRADQVRKNFLALRKSAQSGYSGHGRLPEIAAWMLMGITIGAEFLLSIHTLNAEECRTLIKETGEIIRQLAAEQADLSKAAKPSEKFITALRELLAAETVQVLGLASDSVKDDRFIGWEDESYYYLIPGQVHKAVQQHYRDQGQELGVSPAILLKQLEADGYLEATTRPGGTTTDRSRFKRIKGKAYKVVFLYKSKVSIEDIEEKNNLHRAII